MHPGDESSVYEKTPPTTPEEARRARVTIAEAGLTGGWASEVPTLIAMLGVDK